jgi:hypothetical protein
MQELMINAVKTFVLDMGLKAIAFRSEIKSVLNQLVVMSNEDKKPSAFEKEVPVFNMNQEQVNYEDIDDTIIDNPVVESNINVPLSSISVGGFEDITEISETEI